MKLHTNNLDLNAPATGNLSSLVQTLQEALEQAQAQAALTALVEQRHMHNAQAADEDDQILVTPARAAELWGVSRATMYRLIASGRVPSVYVPGTRIRRIPMNALRSVTETDGE
jgi:excisionase family DNA binding protein